MQHPTFIRLSSFEPQLPLVSLGVCISCLHECTQNSPWYPTAATNRHPTNSATYAQTAEFLAVAELGGARGGAPGGGGRNDHVLLAAPLSKSSVDAYLKCMITERTVR